jgi:DNA repair photolyase
MDKSTASMRREPQAHLPQAVTWHAAAPPLPPPLARLGGVQARKGRGVVSETGHRFETLKRHADLEASHDLLQIDPEFEASLLASPQTKVEKEIAKSIVSTNDSPDLPFEQSINPYRGCEHGCVYCYARPSHAFLGLSPGLDFETRLSAKINAKDLLLAHLSRKNYKASYIHLGANTDAYQPIEREWRLTRQVVELMAELQHPFTITTKASLVEREIDLLAPLAKQQLVSVMISVTSLDSELSRNMEPRAAAPWRRIETIRRLAEAGVPVGVSVAPLIPFINEPEIEKILEAARQAGASFAHYTVLRMPWEVRPLVEAWLAHHYPERAARVLARIEDMRGGKRNDPRFMSRMKGQGFWADMVNMRFTAAAKKQGLKTSRPNLRHDLFKLPAGNAGHPSVQATLF